VSLKENSKNPMIGNSFFFELIPLMAAPHRQYHDKRKHGGEGHHHAGDRAIHENLFSRLNLQVLLI